MINFDELMPPIQRHRSIGEPAREIELELEAETLVKESIETLERNGFEVSSIFDLFQGWKSRQTIAARRVLLTVGVLVGGSYWVGVDLSQTSLWGMPLGKASLGRFLIFATVVILASTVVYIVSRHLDRRVQFAKVTNVAESIEPCRAAARQLEKIVHDHDLVSVSALIDDFVGLLGARPGAQGAYDAVLFYESRLERANTIRKAIDALEIISVLAIALYSLFAITSMAW